MRRKKVLSLVLAFVTGLSLCACSTKSSTTESASKELTDAEVYEQVFGEFSDAYDAAKDDSIESTSERYAKMAIAEAKLLETGALLPVYAGGGNYAISRIAPHTQDYCLWGFDVNRFHQQLICDKFLTTEDYNHLRDKWTEISTDSEKAGKHAYMAYAKEYLSGKGYQFTDELRFRVASNVDNWDMCATTKNNNARALVNGLESLLEYDEEGVLQPALAVGEPEISADGLEVTFTIRDGVIWTDCQERKVADLTAQDFVTGLQHVLDAQAGLQDLVSGVIKNAREYCEGSCTFDEVGIKAEGNKLTYTLEKKCPYFTSMASYGCFAPLNKEYFESQGGKLGAEFDSSDSNYKYGSSFENIAYCGPYVCTSYVKDQSAVFKAAQNYWNKDNINVHTIKWVYDDGTDPVKAFSDVKANVISGTGLSHSNVINAQKEIEADGKSMFEKYAYDVSNDGFIYYGAVNLNRRGYANFNDGRTAASPKNDEEKERTRVALLNKNFRIGFVQSIDKLAMNEQLVGKDLAPISLRNSFTIGTFVKLDEDVTVKINDKDTTFKRDTFFGEIVQAQLDADGYDIKVWDNDKKTSDGFDGWYNPEAAKKYLEKAVEELKKEGVTVDKDHPIEIDFPVFGANESQLNKANTVKQSVEKTTDGLIKVNVVDAVSADGMSNTMFNCEAGKDCNYDFCDGSGWAADYKDPSSYLDTMLPDGDGYLTKAFGIY